VHANVVLQLTQIIDEQYSLTVSFGHAVGEVAGVSAAQGALMPFYRRLETVP
jgi:hypothetical protein